MGLAEAIHANAAEIAALDEPDMRNILSVLKDAEELTAIGMREFLAKVDGKDTYTIQRHRALSLQLKEATQLIEHKLAAATTKDLQTESHAAELASIDHLKRVIVAGEKKFRDTVSSLRIKEASVIKSADHALMHRHANSAARYAGRTGLDIQHQLSIGVVRGETVDQLARRLSRMTIKQYERSSAEDVAARAAEINFFKSKADAERLVRTETVHAANFIQNEALKEDAKNGGEGGWMKRWDATFDRRTCGYCEDYNGQTVDVEEPFRGGVEYPPLHANCRCAITPWRKDWDLR